MSSRKYISTPCRQSLEASRWRMISTRRLLYILPKYFIYKPFSAYLTQDLLRSLITSVNGLSTKVDSLDSGMSSFEEHLKTMQAVDAQIPEPHLYLLSQAAYRIAGTL